MTSLIVTFVVTFMASLLLTAVVRALARRWGIVDRPDGKRKLHAHPVPLWGGVAVYLAVVLGLLVADFGLFDVQAEQAKLSMILIVVTGIVCVSGGIDDSWALTSRTKLLLQICSVLPIVAFGFFVDRLVLFGYQIELGWFGIPLTVLWLIGCINALNLLDGMDGLAATVGLLAAAMMAIIAAGMGNDHVAVIAIVLMASLAGFLVYNLPPASIFLGDSGSMVIGLVLGVLGIQGAMKTSATLAITIPAVIMSLPMCDMVLAMVRRRLSGQRVDTADRHHVHHRLLDRGLTQWQALCIIGALCLATGAAATAASIFGIDALAWITVLALMVLVIQMRIFGHHELALVVAAAARKLAVWAHRLVAPGPRRNMPEVAELARLPFDGSWAILVEEVKFWQVSELELTHSCGDDNPRRHTWRDAAAGDDPQPCWSMAMAVRNHEHRVCELRVTGPAAMGAEPLYSTGLTRVLSRFAAHFLERPEQIPVPAAFDEKPVEAYADHQYRSKAA